MSPTDPFFERLPLPCWVYDPLTLRFLAVNESAVQVYGYTREEFLAMNLADIRPGEDLPRLRSHLEIPRRGKDSGIWRHRTKTGQLLEVEVTSSDIQFADTPARLVVVIDVSGRAYQDQRLAIALGGARLGIWEFDIATGMLTWDKVYSGIYGYTQNQLPHTPDQFLQMVDPEHRQRVGDAFFRCVHEGVDYETEFKVCLPDGNLRWRYAYGKRVTDMAGTPVKVIGIGMDTTDRKRLEAEVLQNQKLEAVGRLAGGIAHDFNNLLTVMLGYAEVLQRDQAADLVRQSAEQIQMAATRGARLVRQLLEFSRTRPQSPTLVDLNYVITDSLSFLRNLLPSTMRVVIDLDPAVPRVMADPGQLDQIVMNLCLNARDAIGGFGQITIKTTREMHSHQAQFARLQISDTGCGIPPEHLEVMFDPFFTTKSIDKGTGLGLSIVQSIVKQLGGSIEVKTQAESGTTFSVCLPAAY